MCRADGLLPDMKAGFAGSEAGRPCPDQAVHLSVKRDLGKLPPGEFQKVPWYQKFLPLLSAKI
jgi:hypothetical protein